MSFVVRMKKRKKMVFVRVLCVLMIAVLLWFLNWDLMQETNEELATALNLYLQTGNY